MNSNELKYKIEGKYQDIDFTKYTEGAFNEKANYRIITLEGESKKDKEITTFFSIFVSNDFKEFDELSDFFSVFCSYIDKRYYFGEIIFLPLDNFNKFQNFYSIKLASMNVLRPFSVGIDNEKIWGYGIPGKCIVVNPKYQEAKEYSEEGLAAVKLNDKWGFIDRLGDEVIPVMYEDVNDFLHDWRHNEITYDFKNEWSEKLFTKPQKFRQQFASVKLNNEWGYINKQGEIAIPIKYEEAFNFLQGCALVKSNNKWFFIDRYGNNTILLPPVCDWWL